MSTTPTVVQRGLVTAFASHTPVLVVETVVVQVDTRHEMVLPTRLSSRWVHVASA